MVFYLPYIKFQLFIKGLVGFSNLFRYILENCWKFGLHVFQLSSLSHIWRYKGLSFLFCLLLGRIANHLIIQYIVPCQSVYLNLYLTLTLNLHPVIQSLIDYFFHNWEYLSCKRLSQFSWEFIDFNHLHHLHSHHCRTHLLNRP
jgi:hypothetical protein